MVGRGENPMRRNMKRNRVQMDDQSFTSPIGNHDEEENRTSGPKTKNKADIVELSSSKHDSLQKGKKTDDNDEEDWSEPLNQTQKPEDEGIMLQTDYFDLICTLEEVKQLIIKGLQPAGQSYDSLEATLPPTFKQYYHSKKLESTESKTTKLIIQKQQVRDNVITPKTSPKEVGCLLGDTEKVINKKLFTPSQGNAMRNVIVTISTPTGFYNNPCGKHGNPSMLIASSIPENHVQTNISYALEKEVLVSTDIHYCEGNRSLLFSLRPKEMIEGDVINLMSCVLTLRERRNNKDATFWFLPTTFSQFVISWHMPTLGMIACYQEAFFGKIDNLSKVFIPVHDPDYQHWYLLVVDFVMKELALYMEDLLLHDSFYAHEITERPRVSEFRFHVPEGLGVQRDFSNDCGVWVITWMMEMGVNNYKIEVDEGNRLRIALHLALNPFNNTKPLLEVRAKKYFERFMVTIIIHNGDMEKGKIRGRGPGDYSPFECHLWILVKLPTTSPPPTFQVIVDIASTFRDSTMLIGVKFSI
ncbi:Ulp1 protease family, C-terminal catalytic domain [Sesbania bispinosa]|nr:Ulp1 protease family, C-terminal catalytic domain [Sesbania bispinosa]